MNMHTELASPEDAHLLIDFMNRVGGETDSLSFGEGEFIEQDAERESAYLAHRRDTKVGDQSYDAVAMSRVFHRDCSQPDGPLFYLDDILEAVDFTNDDAAWYACLDTGEVELYYHDNWAGETDFDPETAEGRWVPLPDRFEIDDWRCMQDFACRQEEHVCQRLLDIIHRRGAYRNFKDECARRGLLNDYFAFQDSWHRRVAIDWFEAHDCAWTEGRRPR